VKLARRLWRVPNRNLNGPLPGDLVELLQEADENGEVRLRNTRTHRVYREKLADFERVYESMEHLLTVPYRHWKHRLIPNYEVKVLGVYRHGDAEHATVRVDRGRRNNRPTTWPLLKFLEAFAPLGEPLVAPTCWDRISEEETANGLEVHVGGGRTDDSEPH